MSSGRLRLPPALLLLLLFPMLLLPAPCSGAFSASDLWSGKIWALAQRARDQHASNSDRLMQHMWQRPERADRFVDCDILADSQTDKHFLFVNPDDLPAEREEALSALPRDGYARGVWPVDEADHLTTVHFQLAKEVDTSLRTDFAAAANRWQEVLTVKFVDVAQATKKPANYLKVVRDGGCFATLGFHSSDPRRLSLEPRRCTTDVIVHLLGHVLGLPHTTSTVGREKDCFMMPHHAAPRSFGVLRSSIGELTDPFDIMAVDPWFCGVSNRTTWRPRNPNDYPFSSVTGAWDKRVTGGGKVLKFPEEISFSSVLLQQAIRQQGFISACYKRGPAIQSALRKCDGFCHASINAWCLCLQAYNDTLTERTGLPEKKRCYPQDLLNEFDKGFESTHMLRDIMDMDTYGICIIYHPVDRDRFYKPIAALEKEFKCWQCSILTFSLSAGALFGAGGGGGGGEQVSANERAQFRLIALGSRCTLFSLEANSALEEAWYRVCLHQLVDAAGEIRIAFRGPGSVLLRYYGSGDQFPEFHRAFKQHATVGWTIRHAQHCDCSAGPAAEIQLSTDRP